MHVGRAVVAGVLLLGTACSDDDEEEEGVTTTTTSTTAALDQTPPTGANGVAFDADGTLWVADLAGNEILGVDTVSGAILHRYGQDQGVEGPDDLAFDADGRLWWTGFTTGVVGRIAAPGTPDATSEVVAEPGPGVNPITITDDGRVFVARLNQADALYEIDPASGDIRTVLDQPGNINAFQVGPDGRLYAPRFGVDGAGSVVAIDPDSGALDVVAEGLSLDVSVRVGPDGTVYALAGTPPGVVKIDPRTGATTPFAELDTTVADNMAFAPDGTLYVTAFDRPLAWVISPAGDVTDTLTIGRP